LGKYNDCYLFKRKNCPSYQKPLFFNKHNSKLVGGFVGALRWKSAVQSPFQEWASDEGVSRKLATIHLAHSFI
jgi:hypothetical protein